MIDGSNPKNSTSQTEIVSNGDAQKPDTPSDNDDISDNQTTPDNNDVIVSGDTDIKEAAQTLTDKLIEYSGNDRTNFEKLFRNTESPVIDQYYNTSFDTFKEYGKSLIAVAAENEDSVWFTALYYKLPENYPAEKEKSVYLSTIMTRGNDGWKIEWNDNVRSELQSDYENAGFSSYGREAMEQGYAWAKFFIPFDPNSTMIFYDSAVMCKLTEMYMDESDNLNLTFYASNGTDKDVKLTGMDITVSDGDLQLFSKNFEVDTTIQKDSASLFVLKLYSDELDFTTWSSPKITDFRFSYNEMS